MSTFEQMLTGGHPNSLGNTLQVVDLILEDKARMEDLYQCYFSNDEVVRLRVSNAFKRITKLHPDWTLPYIDRFINEISKIDQASTQWTFAQLIMLLDSRLTDTQRRKAIDVMKNNMQISNDWIVLNFTMEALTSYAKTDKKLKDWLVPYLNRLQTDDRKSVAKRANKYLSELS